MFICLARNQNITCNKLKDYQNIILILVSIDFVKSGSFKIYSQFERPWLNIVYTEKISKTIKQYL